MLPSKKPQNQTSLFFSFDSTLNQKHPLFVLANRIDWTVFENAFSPLYCLDNGRPAKPIRLMVGLLMLKHIRNISDESVDLCYAFYAFVYGSVINQIIYQYLINSVLND